MKNKYIILFMLIFLTGCMTPIKDYKSGQAKVKETQIEGMDMSIPIPFAEGVYLFQFRFGLIQHKSYKGFNVPYYSDSDYHDIYLLKGLGGVKRTLKVGIQ